MPTKERTRNKAAEVRYTPAKPFRRGRFLLYLLTTIAVVLALLFGMAVFFKVADVKVAGGEKYTAQQVMDASGVHKGDNLLTLSQTRIGGRIKAKLPYVDTVRVQIKLPDTVNIEISESPVSYSIEAANGTWWLMTSRGMVTEQTQTPDLYAKITGVQLDSPEAGAEAKAYAAAPASEATTAPQGENVLPVSTEAPGALNPAEQLQTALEIIAALEKNGLLSGIASVDVSSPLSLEFWYGTQYQVTLGSTENLAYKVEAAKKAMEQMDAYESGVLDVSFTTWQNQVGYTPFS